MSSQYLEKEPLDVALHEETVKAPAVDRPVYDEAEREPELHWRTYVAMASMCLLSFVQLTALLGPSTAVCPHVTLRLCMHWDKHG